MSEGVDLPLLQENVDGPVWTDWAPVYRDVIILDGDNIIFGVFNLTTYNLSNPDAYAALRQLFVDAALSL